MHWSFVRSSLDWIRSFLPFVGQTSSESDSGRFSVEMESPKSLYTRSIMQRSFVDDGGEWNSTNREFAVREPKRDYAGKEHDLTPHFAQRDRLGWQFASD